MSQIHEKSKTFRAVSCSKNTHGFTIFHQNLHKQYSVQDIIIIDQMGSEAFDGTLPKGLEASGFKEYPHGSKTISSTAEAHDASEEGSVSNSSIRDDSFSGRSEETSTPDDSFGTERGARAIWCTKALFVFMLVVAAAGLSSIVFVMLKNKDSNDFHSEVRINNNVLMNRSSFQTADNLAAFELYSRLSRYKILETRSLSYPIKT